MSSPERDYQFFHDFRDLPGVLKEAMVRPFFKENTFGPYSPIQLPPSVFLIWARWLREWLLTSFRFSWMMLISYIFQSSFQPGYGTETVLVTITDDLW